MYFKMHNAGSLAWTVTEFYWTDRCDFLNWVTHLNLARFSIFTSECNSSSGNIFQENSYSENATKIKNPLKYFKIDFFRQKNSRRCDRMKWFFIFTWNNIKYSGISFLTEMKLKKIFSKSHDQNLIEYSRRYQSRDRADYIVPDLTHVLLLGFF